MDPRKIFLLIIIPSLEGGGSERVIANLVNAINHDKFEVCLCVVLSNKIQKYSVPRNVKIIKLSYSRVGASFFHLWKIIRKIKPDIVLSTLGHLNLLISCMIPFVSRKTKFIARESNTISVHNKSEKYPKLFDFLFRTTYKSFDRIIAQSLFMKNDMVENYGISASKVVLINNPVDTSCLFPEIDLSTSLPLKKKNIIVVGRLSKQKRVEDAVLLMKRLDDSYHLHVLGDGEELPYIKRLIESNDLSERVTLHGFTRCIGGFVSKADCLISTSRYEGLPNVVIESIAVGTPVVSYRSPGGVSEIIVNGENGFLVDDGNVDMLQEFVVKACSVVWDKESIMADAKARFGLEAIIPQYERVFLELVNSSFKK